MLESFSIKHLESLSKTPTRFSVEDPIVSQARIDARLRELQPLVTADELNFWLFDSCLCTISGIFITMRWFSDDSTPHIAIYIALGIILVGLAGIRHWESMAGVRRLLAAELNALATLPSTLCGELLAACQTDPEVDAYRQRVLAEGRAFVQGEFDFLMSHASGAQERADCKALYEVAQ